MKRPAMQIPNEFGRPMGLQPLLRVSFGTDFRAAITA
jgi:hypothetical protein